MKVENWGSEGREERGFLRPLRCFDAPGGRLALAGSRPSTMAGHSHPRGGGGGFIREENS